MLELQFKNSPVATFILDRALKVLRINPAAAGMLTVSPDAAPGRHLRELLAVSETLASSLRKALSANQTVEIQEELLIRGRTRVQYRVTATPAKASQESFLQCFFVEQPLLQNDSAPLNDLDPEQILSRITESIPAILYVFDLQEGRNRFLGPAFERILGWNTEKQGPITMDYFAENLHPDDARQLNQWAGRWETARDDEVYSLRYRLKDTLGSYHWFQTYDKVFSRSDDGRVKEIVGSAIEITDQISVLQDLQAEQSRLQAITTQAPVTVLEINCEGIIQFLNRTKYDYGIPESSMVGHSVYEYVLPEYHVEVRDAMDRALAGHKQVELEVQTAPADGSRPFVLLSLAPLSYEADGNTTVNLLVIAFDITARKRMEQRLEELTARAETASRSKTEFFVTLSHDIRTPMNSIMGIADLLLDTRLDEDQKQMATILRDSSEALVALLERTLQLSRLEMGLVAPGRPSDFSPGRMAEKAKALFQTEAYKRGLELKLELKDLPERIHGVEAALMQVLVSLTSNAVKYTDRGVVTIRLAMPDSKPGDPTGEPYLLLEVEDTGPGIPASEISHVFDLFYQGSQATPGNTTGGIGLNGCKRLVEGMGGEIEIISPYPANENGGTLARVLFPFTLPETSNAEQSEPPLGPLTGKVLLVEDNALNQFVAQRMLENAGANYATAGTVQEALAALKNESFQLVLLDLGLPDGDGRTVVRWMRSRKINTPVVAVTAAAFDEERQSSLEAGMDDFITKPMEQKSLQKILMRFLRSD